jgi:hypothetical protein
MANLPGRREILLVSAGFWVGHDRSSEPTDLIDAAGPRQGCHQRAGYGRSDGSRHGTGLRGMNRPKPAALESLRQCSQPNAASGAGRPGARHRRHICDGATISRGLSQAIHAGELLCAQFCSHGESRWEAASVEGQVGPRRVSSRLKREQLLRSGELSDGRDSVARRT